jgi:hypothetical protein
VAEFAYPSELSQYVSGHWNRMPAVPGDLSECGQKPEILETLISVCYQASMLHDELRPVTFRVIVCQPGCFRDAHHALAVFHILEFEQPREFTARELGILSQAANFQRSLIGIRVSPEGNAEIWGIIHSGPHWLREVYGGRRSSAPLPSSVVICVNGPGYLEVCRGSLLIGQLRDGTVFDESMNIFEASWLPELFSAERNNLLALHEQSRKSSDAPSAELDPFLPRQLAQQFVKRLIAAIQNARHGGTLILVPDELKEMLSASNPYLNIKYRFTAAEARLRYRSILLSIMRHMTETHEPGRRVGWPEYEDSTHRELLALDEALFEMSYLIAGLTAVDGAVLLTKRFEILGFGTEITSNAVSVERVTKALDIEGETTVEESPDGMGTRHRSAFRFVQSIPTALAVVISQDSDVRIVRNRDGKVTYWNHRPSMQTTR